MSAEILLIEDDPDIRETIRDLLDEEGYAVVTAKNGSDALALLQGGAAPSMILLDLLMPVMDGIEFLEHIQRDDRIARIPVLVLSASSVVTPPAGTTLLRKPLSITDLLEAVERMMGGDGAPLANS